MQKKERGTEVKAMTWGKKKGTGECYLNGKLMKYTVKDIKVAILSWLKVSSSLSDLEA